MGRVLQRDALTAVARHELEEISALVDATRCGDRTTDCLSYFRRLRAIWAMADPASFDWHSVATLATWFMTLVIQRAEHRDTQAIHVKLDELLRADKFASTELGQIDNEEPEVIEKRRAKFRRQNRPLT